MTPEHLIPNVVLAMPVGPPYGGMTAYTGMLMESRVFSGGNAAVFDTTPSRGGVARLVHSVKRALALLRLVRRRGASVVYFMSSDYLGFFEKSVLALLCRTMGVKTVIHLIGSFEDFYATAGWKQPVIRWMLRHVSAVITVHSDIQQYVSRLAGSTPVWVIPNPVDCDVIATTFTRRGVRDRVQILFSGALARAKGILDLLAAAAAFKAELAGARIVVIGEGDLADECRRFVQSAGLSDVVELRGFVDESAKKLLLSNSDVYCLPTHDEGMPISVLEAMAAGLPVVSTTVGGIPQVIRQGVDGWLIAPGDVRGLGRALASLVTSEPLRSNMGRNGFERVRASFDISTVASSFISHLNRLA